MYRKTAICMALLLLLSLVASPAIAAEPKPLQVVPTTFPVYDWTRQVLGERAEAVSLHLLQDAGIDLHNFQPTVEDIVRVSSADVFLYIGGPSDHWVKDALKEAVNPKQVSLNLMEALGDQVKQDVTVEGMQEGEHHHHHHDEDHDRDHEHGEDHDHEHEHADHDHEHEHADHDHEHEHADHDHEHENTDQDHDHEHEHGEDHDHDHEHEEGQTATRVHNHADEHIWLSLRNAQVLVAAIRDALVAADPEYQDTYKQNAQAYIEKLQELDQQYRQLLEGKEQKVLLFGDRFPFRYLMEDYGITYYAAFAGCSAETEASFETIAFLSGKVDSLSLKAVLQLDGSDGRIAQAIVRTSDNRNQAVLTLNAMQSTRRGDIENGATYLAIMEENLQVLDQAL